MGNLLITGVPGVGKTTVISKVVKRLRGLPLAGFITREMRAGSQRVGFEIETLDGAITTLAHIDIRSHHRVSKYGVDIEALEGAVSQTLALGQAEIFIVDEIGKMECYSHPFCQAMTTLLDSDATVIATIAKRGSGFITEVKERSDVELWEVMHNNRDRLPEKIVASLSLRLSLR